MRTRIVPVLFLALAGACKCGSEPGPEPVPAAFTLHYHRALSDYDGWTVNVAGGAVETSAAVASRDGWGAVYSLTVKEGATNLEFTLANGSQADAAGPLTVDVSGTVREAWVLSGWAKAIAHRPAAVPSTSQIAVYYLRPDAGYGGWGLHLWGDQVTETIWSAPLTQTGVDADLGAGFLVDVTTGGPAKDCPPGNVCLIVHQGDTKDPGPNQTFDAKVLGNVVFVVSGSMEITSIPRKPGALEIAAQAAHLLSRTLVAWDPGVDGATEFELRHSATAAVKVEAGDVVGGEKIPLTPDPAGLDADSLAKAPHLKGLRALKIAESSQASLEQALRGQLVAVARDSTGKALAATQVQTAFGLDDLYAHDGPLGLSFDAGAPTFRLWAPTAQKVKLHVYDAAKAELAAADMTRGDKGVWSHTGPASWAGRYYRFELDVYVPLTGKIENVVATDPYAAGLSANGLYAQVVDLKDAALKPAGWDALQKPALEAPEDVVVYETHIRDFSARDTSVAADRRGKYLAFAADAGDTGGRLHLKALAEAGLTHVHLLPAFDFGTVEELPESRVDIDQPYSALCAKKADAPLCGDAQVEGRTIAQVLSGLPGDSETQQAIASALAALDAFNWGYDPVHYGAPEGSYASSAEGTARILEFRSMVAGLAQLGLRTVMDVVYNHTTASGLSPRSVLDKVVPGYYHRQDPRTGFVLTSSCCANTATEHAMMRKLMVDTMVRWARDYKVDGFRWDLMGLHLKSDILAVQAALAALTVEHDGVDGSKIYLYGEGWDMGEMAGKARGVNASQLQMGGTGVGTFNDRIRDSVRGGGAFDSGTDLQVNQGFASGLFWEPNDVAAAALSADDHKLRLMQSTDRVKAGMAGNLSQFRLMFTSGAVLPASALAYNGAATGYTRDPQECVNYVSAHDNQTLWDIAQFKLPSARTAAERTRMHDLALDVVALSQGVAFFHLGDELLRSKSMERDSYDSGDWFNRVDWTGQTTAWKSGLPNKGKDEKNWPIVKELFANSLVEPAPADIAASRAHFETMLRVRASSRLFRLTTAADIMKRVDFLNGGPTQVPGVVVMTITDGTCAGEDLDPARDGLVVVVNATPASQTMTVPGATGAVLHPVLAARGDSVVKSASVAGEALTVPGRTAAVFELPQSGAAGAGLPCNTR